jgi:hypothetical protein
LDFIDTNTAFSVFTAVLMLHVHAPALTAPLQWGMFCESLQTKSYLSKRLIIEQLAAVDVVVSLTKTGTITITIKIKYSFMKEGLFKKISQLKN